MKAAPARPARGGASCEGGPWLPRRRVLAAAVACAFGAAGLRAEPRETLRRIVVLDADSAVVGIVAAPTALLELAEHWAARVPAGADAASRFDFKLDVITPQGSTRWLYDATAGRVQLTGGAGAGVFQLPDAAAFGRLVGVLRR